MWRGSVHVRALHPELFSRTYIWTADKGATLHVPRRIGVERTDLFLKSPIARVFTTGEPLRCRLEDPRAKTEFPINADLIAQGITDYAVWPVPVSSGQSMAITLGTRRPGGFGDADIALFRAVLPAFAPLLELRQLELDAKTLLGTYLGRDIGDRVLAGEIRRGTTETIRAVLWLSDISGYSKLSEQLPREAVIQLLNDFYDCIVPPLIHAGGDVLKFIGDGMLAIFPLAPDEPAQTKTAAALLAAQSALARLADLNVKRSDLGKPPIRSGLALHIGDVLYGNIGASARLDFTVIGPAVNRLARIEKLKHRTGESLLLSAEFVAACTSARFRSLGRHTLPGNDGSHEIFAPEANSEN